MLNACLAGTIGDQYGILSWILGFLLRLFFYREFWDMAPPMNGPNDLYSGTPIVNSRVFELMVSLPPSHLYASHVLTHPSRDKAAPAGCEEMSRTSREGAYDSPDVKLVQALA